MSDSRFSTIMDGLEIKEVLRKRREQILATRPFLTGQVQMQHMYLVQDHPNLIRNN